jgi:hypothetical protein
MNSTNNNNNQTKKTEKKMIKADIAKVLNKGSAGENILRSNTYLKAIVDPFNVHGCRIPDLVTTPSSTFAILDRRVLTVSSGGLCGMTYGIAPKPSADAAGSLVPLALYASSEKKRQVEQLLKPSRLSRSGNDSKMKILDANRFRKISTPRDRLRAIQELDAFDASSYEIGCILPTGASTADLFTLGGTPPVGITFDQWNISINTIQELFQNVRLVSCGVAVNFTGNLTDSDGTMTLAFLPRRSLIRQLADANIAISLAQIQELPGSRILPLNDLKGGTVVYTPQDSLSLAYVNEQELYDYTGDTGTWPDAAMGGEFYIIISGADSGRTIQISSVFNYEGIPNTGNVNLIQTIASPSDPIGLSHAFNVLESVPNVIGNTAKAQGLVNGKTQLVSNGSLTSSSMGITDTSLNSGSAPKKQESLTDKLLGALGTVGNKVLDTAVDNIPKLLGML